MSPLHHISTAGDSLVMDSLGRPSIDGKFLCVGGHRFLVKGATYGTFAPDSNGVQFPTRERVATDFALMAQHGLNTVRTYTLPPASVLDEAARHGLRVMAGVPWSQHVAFLDDRTLCRDIRRTVASQVRTIANHPALLMVALGNEIPSTVVRWHGRARTERFLADLFHESKASAPDTLFTYVNYPPTEYLDLPFLDLVAFNVYLHREADMRAYVARLHMLAGNKPLLLAELGSDSIRQGEAGQAELTAMQVSAAFREGACGAVAFAWTDEWWRGGFAVEDWAFGLVDAARTPKPALHRVARVFTEAPFPAEEQQHWPKVSVVVCAYNAGDTIDECLTSLGRLNYPDYEVVVVNDGSRDNTGDIARRHTCATVIDTPNNGLSAARNTGLHHSTGAIVAYTDADVRVGEDWLTYLVQPFLTSDVVGSGGPNVAPPDDPWMAQCVARAPGAPTHVLLDNRIAEHVPGCNMAFRRDVLLDVGGFNPIYRRAGDDVDLCWRVQARGWKIGFAPAALVWHHHRATLRGYWRQQAGYGEGEQWLMPHHPDRFKDGQAIWRGHIYSPLPFVRAMSRAQINTGQWGTAPFPSVYLRESYPFAYMPHKVRWLFGSMTFVVVGASFLTIADKKDSDLGQLLLMIGWLGLAITMVKCFLLALQSDISALPAIGRLPHWASRLVYRSMIGPLHFVQPFARAYGRIRGMLADIQVPAREPAKNGAMRTTSREVLEALGTMVGLGRDRRFWGETWTDAASVLSAIRDRLQHSRTTRAIKIDDGWQLGRDISVQTGRWTWLDLRVLVEDHGSGKELARVSTRVRLVPNGLPVLIMILAAAACALALVLAPRSPASYIAVSGVVLVCLRWLRRTAAALIATHRCVAEGVASRAMHPVGPPLEVAAPSGLVGAQAKKTSS